jgi:hypothetical protein
MREERRRQSSETLARGDDGEAGVGLVEQAEQLSQRLCHG